jgi:hypothetical protein
MIEHGTNFVQPPPELIEGEEEYEVDQIMNSRCHGKERKLQFLIRWKGYSQAHDSWEDAQNVHAPKLVEEYFRRKQTAIHALEDKNPERSTKGGAVTHCHSPVPLLSISSLRLMSHAKDLMPTVTHAASPTSGRVQGDNLN